MVGGLIERLLSPFMAGTEEAMLNRRLRGYPHNHDYRVRGTLLEPSRKLLKRWKLLSPLYPQPMPGFLDVGSCKGFFELQAAMQGCPRAVGMDVHAPFVDLSAEVARRLGLGAAQFHRVTLKQLAEGLGIYGGPFHTVQVISTYHYLYWGSGLEPSGYGSHEAILGMLARVCSMQVIFANPLEIADAPWDIQQKAARLGPSRYTRAEFLAAASAYFEVQPAGFLERKRPILRLLKR
jgi:hypothetical protein